MPPWGVGPMRIAFDGFESLQAAVEAVKASGGGGVPVVATASRESVPARSVAQGAGVEALVDRLGPRADRGLASHLLGDVLLVEGWTAAWSLVTKHPELRAVTPEGDLVSSNGVQIASPDGAGPAMLESAEVELETAETDLSRAVSIHTAAKRDFEKSRDLERKALEDLESAETGLSGRTEAMARLQKSVDVLEGERSRLAQRRNAGDRGGQRPGAPDRRPAATFALARRGRSRADESLGGVGGSPHPARRRQGAGPVGVAGVGDDVASDRRASTSPPGASHPHPGGHGAGRGGTGWHRTAQGPSTWSSDTPAVAWRFCRHVSSS